MSVVRFLGSLGLCYLMFLPVYGQVTIGRGDMPNPGDTIRVSRRQLAGAAPEAWKQTGEDVFINFIPLLTGGQQEVVEYLSSFQTPYAFYFINTYGTKNRQLEFLDNVLSGAAVSISNVMDFYREDQGGFSAIGRGLQINGFPAPAYFQDKDEIYFFPLTYGRRDSSTFAFDASLPAASGGGGGYKSTGNRVTTADGWGKIVTPKGIYDAIRVTSVVTLTDVVTIPAGVLPLPFPIPPITINYRRIETKWLARNGKIPIVEIVETILPGNAIQTEVSWQDVTTVPIQPAFRAISDTEGCYPLPVVFQDQTPGANNWLWEFGDGAISSEKNPTHIYTRPGVYSVRLLVSRSNGTGSTEKTSYVTVTDPGAAFTNTPLQTAEVGEAVRFINETPTPKRGTYQFRWQFGDGSFSADPSPTHTYRSPGVYTVRMTVLDPSGCQDTVLKENLLTVGRLTHRNDPTTGPVRLYPNPAADYLTLAFDPAAPVRAQRLQLIDLTGRIVYETVLPAQPEPTGTFRVDVSTCPAGIYQTVLTTDTGGAVIHAGLVTVIHP